jgi:signal transduction histidine kinase
MSTVQRIIEAHGGTIEIGEPQPSSEGSGTVLKMCVPRRPPQATDEAF